MATIVINSSKVESFDQWKQGFDAGAEMRAKAGIVIKGVYQSADDANSVTVISEFPNADTAKAVVLSPEMKAAQSKSGLTGIPEIKILNLIF